MVTIHPLTTTHLLDHITNILTKCTNKLVISPKRVYNPRFTHIGVTTSDLEWTTGDKPFVTSCPLLKPLMSKVRTGGDMGKTLKETDQVTLGHC